MRVVSPEHTPLEALSSYGVCALTVSRIILQLSSSQNLMQIQKYNLKSITALNKNHFYGSVSVCVVFLCVCVHVHAHTGEPHSLSHACTHTRAQVVWCTKARRERGGREREN